MKGEHQMHIKPAPLLLSLTVVAVLAGSANLMAHGGAKGIVKERMEVMKSIGKAMKSISKMARGKAPLDADKVAASARSIARHGQRIPAMFPKGSSQGVTEASPRIWQDPEGFKQGTQQMVDAARSLEAAARSDDAGNVKAAFASLGKTCGTCHKQFRIKKKRKH